MQLKTISQEAVVLSGRIIPLPDQNRKGTNGFN